MSINSPASWFAALTLTAGFLAVGAARADDPWVVYEGREGPGQGKHIVLISGDEEYRSEEALPQLGKILAVRHGFKCTVLFAIDPEDGTINPNVNHNIPGLEALKTADLMIIATRFRNLADEQMQHVVDYVESGRPIIGMRTATHAFNIPADRKFARYSFRSQEWDGGFGRQILGETWISHHGAHGREATRGVLVEDRKDHPILRGVEDIFGPTDVYTVRLPLPGDSQPLVLGQVVAGMNPDDPPVAGPKNDPMMPIAWTKTYRGAEDRVGRVFTTTMGDAVDLNSEGFRRLLVNATYWCVGLEEKIPPKSAVDLVGQYEPSFFGFNKFRKGVKPADHRL
jgi:type 1 glutamine amidotransferase